ncbi:MAG: hypothetical protein L6Q99_08855 [Planctomycetes bacterium]|nr:hypothetical protein [Planctomycetota bacterium]
MIEATIRRSRLLASVSVYPEHVWDRATTARVLAELFPRVPRAEIDLCVERCGVEERRLFFAPEHWARRDTRAASELATRAAREALAACSLTPDDCDELFVVTDARAAPRELEIELGERLELRRTSARVLVDAAGGAAGASALGLAAELAAHGKIALVVVVACAPLEACVNAGTDGVCCAATLGHGVAATVFGPESSGRGGWRVEATGSWLAPDARDATSGRVECERSLFSRHLPGAVVRFLSKRGMSVADIGQHVVHGSARSVLERYAELFRVCEAGMRLSRRALARHGDLAAAALPAMFAALAGQDGQSDVGDSDARTLLAVASGPGKRLGFLLCERCA